MFSTFVRNRTRPFKVALLFLVVLSPAAKAFSEQLPIKVYTTADGLARDSVNCIRRDSHGFLWFCTEEGLSRYDGYEFKNYTTEDGLPSRRVNDLLETRDGIYWVATDRGLCRFDPNGVSSPGPNLEWPNGEPNFPQHLSTDDPQAETSAERMFGVYVPGGDTGSLTINALYEDHNGTIWCATNGGLYRFEQTRGKIAFQSLELGSPIDDPEGKLMSRVLEDRSGVLWVGALSSGLYQLFPDGHVNRYTTKQGLTSNGIKSLLEDGDGRVWVGTSNGLCLLRPQPPQSDQNIVAQVFTAKDGLANYWVGALFQSSDRKLWVGANWLNEFIPTAGKNEKKFRAYTKAPGLNIREINALAEDRDGNLWIGTDSSGAMKLARNGFTTFGPADGISEFGADSIFETRSGELCVTRPKKSPDTPTINCFDGRRFVATTPAYPKNITYFSWGWNQIGLQDQAGEWWLPTGQGLVRFPKVTRANDLAHTPSRRVYTTKDGLSTNDIFRVFEDSHGNIWFTATGAGKDRVCRWQRANDSMHCFSDADGLPSMAGISFREDTAGSLWIGADYARLARYKDGRFQVFTAADGVPPHWIYDIYQDRRGRVWIASSRGGLSRIDDPDAEQPHFTRYSMKDGLSSNETKCITEDQWGRIYIGTGRGLDRLDPANGHIKHYTAADGLIPGDVLVALRDHNGALWFGSGKGVSRLIPEPDEDRSPPAILVKGLRIAGEVRHISELGTSEIPEIELGPGQNNLQVDFVGLDFAVGDVLRYQYKLEGSEQDWSTPGEQRTVNYANLAPGSYRFLVRAVNSEDIASSTPATISFRILRPVWQRWWFVTLVAVAAALLIRSVHRYRVAQLLEMERMRTRIATDLHDDIGSSLSQISILSELVRRRLNRGDLKASESLVQIGRTSRELVDSMSDIVWAINPRRDRVRDLTQRMRAFASDVFTARNIAFNFDAPDADNQTKLNADARRQVFMIFKESVNNLVRHSSCRNADIEFVVEHDRLVLNVTDDGKGFDPVSKSDGHGLVSMRERAKNLGGDLSVASDKGQGTKVMLRMPLNDRSILKRLTSLLS
jgi:ligand-binding sensor domain-containing protein/signal transduction histidine kinase